ADSFGDVHLAVGAGEGDDRDVHRHAHTAPDTAAAPEAASTAEIVAVESSITGLDRKRWHRSSTRAAAVAWSAASTRNRIDLPTDTPLTPSKPRAGRARSIVAPCGSAMPGRR